MKNITKVNFNTNFSVLEDIENDFVRIIEKYDGQVSLAAFVGLLEIVKSNLLKEQ
jgi:hypothetical protein